jgi:hypothetical protein
MGGIKRTRANREATEAGGKIISKVLKRADVFKTGKGKPVEVTIRFNDKMDAKDFRTKAESLQRLSRDGKLKVTKPNRDPDITAAYRSKTIRKLTARRRGDSAAQNKIRDMFRFKTSAAKAGDGKDPDHVHELQLGGADHPDNLRWMDAYTNRTIGSQIHSQIRNLPEGTPVIIKVEGP